MSKIRNAVHKVATQLNVWNLSPDEMVAFQRSVHATATASAQYQTAPAIQAADSHWQQAATALDAANTQVQNAEAALEAARVVRAQSVLSYKLAATSYGNAVQIAAQADPGLVAEFGLTLRSNVRSATAAEAPTNVGIRLSKSGGFPRLCWHITAQATCVVQATLDPTGETGWLQIAVVRGESLRLNPVPPATTLYRVARVFRGSPGPWSLTATFGKP